MIRGEYIGYFGGYQYTETPSKDFGLGPGYICPVRICAAKCTRWFRAASEDHREGLCPECYVTLFEGEDDIPLERSACYETH